MKQVSKYKIEKAIIIPIIIFAIISFLSIYSAEKIMPYENHLILKQFMWYFFGIGLIFLIMKIKNTFFYQNIMFFYVLGILSLIILLIIGVPINNAKCWFKLGSFTIQPSEFMKIVLIITLAKTINDHNEKLINPSIKEEIKLLLKILLITGIPSVLTFLQPDTGVVLIYILITITMLFISGIRYGWFILIGILSIVILSTILIIYFYNQTLFISIFKTSFFLRVDRLLDWSSNSGYQLQNALMASGSGGLFGNGFNNISNYFPEPHTDFIFTSFTSCFGLIGAAFLISTIMFFNIKLINIALKTNKNINKYVLSGILGMLLYQQIQNIGMNIGLLPITGITLPFISYGGSSLLSYMIIIGIICNISNENLRFTNK